MHRHALHSCPDVVKADHSPHQIPDKESDKIPHPYTNEAPLQGADEEAVTIPLKASHPAPHARPDSAPHAISDLVSLSAAYAEPSVAAHAAPHKRAGDEEPDPAADHGEAVAADTVSDGIPDLTAVLLSWDI